MYIMLTLAFCMAVVFSCYKLESNQSTLTVENLPEGEYFLSVYSIDMEPDTLLFNYERRVGFAALANGISPFNLIWFEDIAGGNKYVIIKTSIYGTNKYITKYGVAAFSKNGNATIDWDKMLDLMN